MKEQRVLVGQVWETRNGREYTITGFQMSQKFKVIAKDFAGKVDVFTEYGKYSMNQINPMDLVTLVRDVGEDTSELDW